MGQQEARRVLGEVGQSTVILLRALRAEVRLGDHELGQLVGETTQTARRWRKGAVSEELPHAAAAAVEELREIVAMLIEADYDSRTIRSFLRSRNTGLGKDRPLDGLRVGVGGFRRVQHVTDCFLAGTAPEPGPSVLAIT